MKNSTPGKSQNNAETAPAEMQKKPPGRSPAAGRRDNPPRRQAFGRKAWNPDPAAIARVKLETPRGSVSPTASFGVAVAGKHFSFDAGDLLEAVDVALYQAKQCGRNRVDIAAPAPLVPAS